MYKSKLLKALDVLDKEYREAMLNEDNDLILAIQNQQSAYTLALRLLDNEPTAYSVDKVVEELEENSSRYTKKYVTPYGNNGYKDTKAVSIHKAIEIVRQGCVAVANNATTKNDDVCECRLLKGYNFLHKTSCGDVFEMENGFKFCPYCGKKIKIVGG